MVPYSSIESSVILFAEQPVPEAQFSSIQNHVI